jgi:hypothetical protein
MARGVGREAARGIEERFLHCAASARFVLRQAQDKRARKKTGRYGRNDSAWVGGGVGDKIRRKSPLILLSPRVHLASLAEPAIDLIRVGF